MAPTNFPMEATPSGFAVTEQARARRSDTDNYKNVTGN